MASDKSDQDSTPKQATRAYSFPEHSITVQATSTADAEEKLKAELKNRKGEKSDD